MSEETRSRLRAIMQLTAAFGDKTSALNEVADVLAAHRMDLAAVSSLPPDMLKSQLLFSEEQARWFTNAASQAGRFADRLDSPFLSVIARDDVGWPSRVDSYPKREMMPWLVILGDVLVLSKPALSFGGSRNATMRSLEITGELVQELVNRDVVIVSGGARGIDAAAHRTALEQGGRTVVVLAQGIGTFEVPSHWWNLIGHGRLVIVSEFSPSATWESHHALQRNATMARLGDGFVVVQAEEMSGTLSAGRSTLRLRRPLHVVKQQGLDAERFSACDQLLASGGLPLYVEAGQPICQDAITALVAPRLEITRAADQMRLF